MNDKQFASLQARAALAGVTLERTTDDSERPAYVLTTGALTITLRTPEQIEARLSQAAPVAVLEGTDAP